MLSSDLTYRAGLAHIGDLRLEADRRRRAGLGSRREPAERRVERNPRPLRALRTLMPHRPARA
jgi:hypothetical protein